MRSWLLLALVLSPVAGHAAGGAQLEMGIFRGTVEDEQGNPVPGVQFHLKDLSRGGEVTFETDNRGNFYKRSLPPGEYELVVDKEGYDSIHDRLVLKPGEETRLKFRLVAAVTPAEAAFQRGIESFNGGDYAKAAAAFEEVVRLAPGLPEAHTNLGLVYVRLGRMEDGITQLEQAAASSPSDQRAQFQLAAAYVEARQSDKAIALFEKGLAGASGLADQISREAAITLASLYFAKGEVERAINTYNKVIGVQAASPAALLGLGKCYFNKGDVPKALGYFNQVVQVAPDSPQAIEARAFIKELEKAKGQPEV